VKLIERWRALVHGPPAQLRFDEAAFLVAAHAYPGLDVGAQRARLDELASRCPAPTLDALVVHLFVDERFAGNRADYYDPRNSYLNDVLDRRLGIPITLSLLALEVGRRLGVPLSPVGLPGHFVLRDKVDTEVFVDPFAGGRLIDRDGCERRFREVQGADAPFDDAWLAPMAPTAVLARLLANLRAVFTARGDRAGLAWVLALRVEVPGVDPAERRELAAALAGVGRFDLAAGALEEFAEGETLAGRTEDAARARRHATLLRARLN
jgi:regulator of sirC expression with transglutaminase-like and TPR domain